MKEFINRWMTRNSRCRGVLACGLRHPDQTTFNQPLDSGLSEDSLNASWDCLAEAFAFLHEKQAEAGRLCWAFEKHRVYAARRGDDTCLGVITQAGEGASDWSALEKMLAEFQSLRGPARS